MSLFNHVAKKPIIKAKLSFAKRWSDESESVVEDPDQTRLPLDAGE